MKSVGVDTETVGFQGPPYTITAYREDLGVKVWMGSISTTGEVEWDPEVIEEVNQFILGCRVITHNGYMFDRWKLESVGVTVHNLHDTMLASHVCNSQDPRGLKELSYQYLGLNDADEEELLEQCRQARRIVNKCKRSWSTGKLSSGVTWNDVSKFRDVVLPDSVKGGMWLIPLVFPHSEIHNTYAGLDAWRTWALWEGYGRFPGYYQIMQECGWFEPYKYLCQLCEPLHFMETTGICVDPTAAAHLMRQFTEEAIAISKHFSQTYGVNVRSTAQLRDVFFQHLGGSPYIRKVGKSGPSLDKPTLTNIVDRAPVDSTIHQEAARVLQYRNLDKKVDYASQYVSQSDSNHVLRVSFNPVGTATCRRSSSRPNAQNITGPIRRMFVPRPNYSWILIDYSNLELRIFAYLAQEFKLLKWFKEGKDVHQHTGDSVAATLASRLPPCELRTQIEAKIGSKEIRTVGKLQNFTLLYGGGADKLAQLWLVHAGIRIPEPRQVLEAHHDTFPGIKPFTHRLIYNMHQDRGRIFNAYGYPLVPPPDRDYAAVDFIVQGTAGQLCGRALCNTYTYLRDNHLLDVAYPVLEIHDEIVFEVHEDHLATIVPTLKEIMEDNGLDGLSTPVDINICEFNWGEEHQYRIS